MDKTDLLFGKIAGFYGDYRFLSNFWYANTKYDGVVYKTSEHAYQAAKTIIPEEREAIRAAASPSEAKKMGKTVTLRPDWENIKLQVMEDLVYDKFERNPKLLNKLLDTEDAYLEETNTWHDTYWGVCNGVGENHLGLILMKVREHLRKELS